MKKLILSFISVLLLTSIKCQTSQPNSITVNRNNIYLGFGLSYYNQINLNSTLNSNKLQTINPLDIPTSLGANYFRNRIGINTEFTINGGLLNSNKTRLSILVPRIGFNYLLSDHSDFNFGINFNYSYVSAFGKIYYQTDSSISANSITASNGGLIEVNNNSHNAGLFFFANFLSGKTTVFLKIGYDYSLTNYSWQVINNNSTGFPKEKFDRLYFTFGFSLNKAKTK